MLLLKSILLCDAYYKDDIITFFIICEPDKKWIYVCLAWMPDMLIIYFATILYTENFYKPSNIIRMNLSLCGASTDINVNVVSCTDITHGNKIESENDFKKRKGGRSCLIFYFENVLWGSAVFHLVCK